MSEENEKTKPQITDLYRDYRGGRPPEYSDPEAMHMAIYEYLRWEDASSKGKYTIEGCALYLGFASRQSMYDYQKRNEQFSYILGKFFLFMTHYHAQRLTWAGSYMGSQFWLKNWGGYKDEVTNNNNNVVTEVTFTKKTREEK